METSTTDDVAQYTWDSSQRYVSGSEDEDEITLLDAMQTRFSNFNRFTDLQYLAHPIHHRRMRHLIQLSAEHSLSTENAVERLICVVQGLATRIEQLENVLVHSLRSGDLQVRLSSRSRLSRSRSLSPTRLPLPSTRRRNSQVSRFQSGLTATFSNPHCPSILSPSLTEPDSQATELNGVFYPRDMSRNATRGPNGLAP